jgi:16S rRNA (cytidine1402-2'-O)-methyltransferase
VPLGILYVVSTPIGNLGDVSGRAIEVLRGVSLILAEDTRHARILLERYEIGTRVASYHEHNEARASRGFVARLLAGDNLALISDAGTPLLSDPGARLVRTAIDAGIEVSAVPGPSALLAALVVSGLAADHFTFFGFLPRRGRERSAVLEAVVELSHLAVLYEAPGRTATALSDLEAAGAGGRAAAVSRELTKQFEETRRGTVAELAAYYRSEAPRGEVVIMIAGAEPVPLDESLLRDRVNALRSSGATPREIVAALIAETGAPRNLAYRLAHDVGGRSTEQDAKEVHQ